MRNQAVHPRANVHMPSWGRAQHPLGNQHVLPEIVSCYSPRAFAPFMQIRREHDRHRSTNLKANLLVTPHIFSKRRDGAAKSPRIDPKGVEPDEDNPT